MAIRMDITMRMMTGTMMTTMKDAMETMDVTLIPLRVNGQNGSQGRAHPVADQNKPRRATYTGMKNRK
jgi:hypothetical protein